LIREGIKEKVVLRVFVADTTGRRHWCRFSFDPSKWAQAA
jgi:hypothetical protein